MEFRKCNLWIVNYESEGMVKRTIKIAQNPVPTFQDIRTAIDVDIINLVINSIESIVKREKIIVNNSHLKEEF